MAEATVGSFRSVEQASHARQKMVSWLTSGKRTGADQRRHTGRQRTCQQSSIEPNPGCSFSTFELTEASDKIASSLFRFPRQTDRQFPVVAAVEYGPALPTRCSKPAPIWSTLAIKPRRSSRQPVTQPVKTFVQRC
jgi:hypothetical protein